MDEPDGWEGGDDTDDRPHIGPRFASVLRGLVDESLRGAIDWLASEAQALDFPITPDPQRPAEQCGANWIDRAIYVNPSRTPGRDVLWDLVHEHGHLLQGAPPSSLVGTERLARERDAWDRGWARVVEAWPAVVAYEAEFREHATACLASYS